MNTIHWRMTFPGSESPHGEFQTPDLDSCSEGGYEVSPDGRLQLVAPFGRGGAVDTTQVGPVPFTGALRLYRSGAGRMQHEFSAEFTNGTVVSAPRPVSENRDGVDGN